jgi:3-hydroxyethyl bacteriochlorophyllide a dehydrogenase
MNTTAVVFAAPEHLELKELSLIPSDNTSAVVDIQFSGISSGTERLLWTGRMPPFPGMGYPLVPGYESVGRVSFAPHGSTFSEGDFVFVPGANCYGHVRGLFGGAASRVSVPDSRLVRVDSSLGEDATLVALAATAHHAVKKGALPELVIGHGVLGRLIARVTVALGGKPVVWETQAIRRQGSKDYTVISQETDGRKDYACIADASGDADVLDRCIGHLARQGEIILAGFYSDPLHFIFPPAFMREASIHIAAQWQPADLRAVIELVSSGRLSLAGLITHRASAADAPSAYETAFHNPGCLKMVLDWSTLT